METSLGDLVNVPPAARILAVLYFIVMAAPISLSIYVLVLVTTFLGLRIAELNRAAPQVTPGGHDDGKANRSAPGVGSPRWTRFPSPRCGITYRTPSGKSPASARNTRMNCLVRPQVPEAGLRRMPEILAFFQVEGRLPARKAKSAHERGLASWLYRRRREAAAGTLSPSIGTDSPPFPAGTPRPPDGPRRQPAGSKRLQELQESGQP